MEAGLGEITFSLHGHTAELHDHLTQAPGAFARLMKGMIRALRDPAGPIVNVDVVINRQNVAVLDRIVELAISVGVTEFDLLHVIPQANAFDNRDQMFYDVREHLPVLHKVFRLNRHPRFVIWTNRFPVEFLEGMEELIQDPHKMLDEVNGRRFMVRNYLDTGRKLECRDPERCKHCFIEPFCTSMDGLIEQSREEAVEVWTLEPGERVPAQLPLGCSWVGWRWSEGSPLPALPAGVGLELSQPAGLPLPEHRPLRLIAEEPEQLEAWHPARLPEGVELLVRLNRRTGPWLLERRADLGSLLHRWRLEQPTHEHLREAAHEDLRDPAAFFEALALPVRQSGLAACQAPGSQLCAPIARVGAALFDAETGRVDIRAMARRFVQEDYRAWSVRCADCRLRPRCSGIHINQIRDQGLSQARPLREGSWAEEADRQLRALHPEPLPRVGQGAPLQAPAPSLPGFAPPSGPVVDPLVQAAERLKARRAARLAEQR
jgi:hypothetical protein